MVLRQHYLTRGDSVQPWLGNSFAVSDTTLSDQEEAVLLKGGGSALQWTVGVPDEALLGPDTEGQGPRGGGGGGVAAATAAPQQQEVEMSRVRFNGSEGAGVPAAAAAATAGVPPAAAATAAGMSDGAHEVQEDVLGLLVRGLLRSVPPGCS